MKNLFLATTLLLCSTTQHLHAQRPSSLSAMPKQAMPKNTRAYALHTVIDLYNCPSHTYSSIYTLTSCTTQICSRLGIYPIGEPSATYHQAGYGYSSGYTVTQQATGHTTITLHVDELRGDVYVDVFSAMRYDDDMLRRFLIGYFQARSSETDAILRN